MELSTLYQLMDRFAHSGLTALEWRNGEEQVVLKREGTAAVSVAAPSVVAAPAEPAVPVTSAPAAADGEVVTAPLVGTFYACPSPDEPPCVTLGQMVSKG